MLPQHISKTDPAYSERVARLAHRYWELRGCPIGSSEDDWYRAEHEIAREWEPYGPLRFDGRP